MELQVYAIIAIVFLVSLCSLLFINKQLRGGKTFEDVLAEKRQFAEKLYGNSGGKNFNKKNPKKLNEKNNKKNKDRANNNKKIQEKGAINSEADAQSDSGSGDDGNTSPTPDNKLHVEFVEAEIIAADDTVVSKKSLNNNKRANQQAAVRKNSATKPPGSSILINKNDSGRSSGTNVAVDLNHFEESQPKDDWEIRKHRDDSIVNGGHKKEGKKSAGGKPNNKKEHSPKQTAAAVAATNVIHELNDQPMVNAVTEIAIAVAANAAQRESPKNQPNKQNKKKKNDALLVQKLVDAGVASTTTDDVNVNVIMQYLGRTELTRSEIQILIDFLLNKQQDSINVNNCDWSDDIVQKLRRQVEEKDRRLTEEQAAAVALQSKLRELRVELNNERIQSHQRVNANADRLTAVTDELQQLQQEHQASSERSSNEKKALEYQLKQLQANLFQEKQLQSQEAAAKLQQLGDTNATLTTELLTKNAAINELQEQFLHSRNEFEQKFQERVRQSETELAHLNSENQRLRGECSRKEEYEKVIARQTAQLEQLEARLAEQSKANNHLDDTSKVEIRNLQNALDSTKAELSLSRKEATDSTRGVGDLTAQLADLKRSQESSNVSAQEQFAKQIEELNGSIKSYQTLIAEKDATLSEYKIKAENAASSEREKELFDELASYKTKNNDLRQKNWKLVDALRTAEDKANKSSSSNHSNLVINNHADERVVALTDEQVRTKQILERLFPNAITKSSAHKSAGNYNDWLTTITAHIENHLQQQQTNANNCNSISKSNGTADGNDDGARQITDELILQNAKLKTTVDDYKSIVADTESVLANLEKKVMEQDAYWRKVVHLKDDEIENLKQSPIASS